MIDARTYLMRFPHAVELDFAHAMLNDKPYFGPVMAALQNYPERYRYLDAILKAVATSKPQGDAVNVLEVGSWAGASTITWALSIIETGREGRVTCVDTWKPYFNPEIDSGKHYVQMYQAAAAGDALKLFLHNIRTCGVEDIVDYIVGDSQDILPRLPQAGFDIVYIDGSHVYDAVRFDIRHAKMLAKNHGVICGDDLELQRNEVNQEEHAALVSSGKDYCLDIRSGQNYHPGVTEAAGLEFEELTVHEGVWAVQKLGQRWFPADVDVTMGDIPPPISAAWGRRPAELIGGSSDCDFLRAVPVGETRGYNLVDAGGRFLAISKALGPVSLFSEMLGERELAPCLLIGDTLDEVTAKVQQMEPKVELVGESPAYNLVKAGEGFLAVSKELGPMNLFEEVVGRREMAPWVLAGDTLSEVRRRARIFQSRLFRVIARIFFRRH